MERSSSVSRNRRTVSSQQHQAGAPRSQELVSLQRNEAHHLHVVALYLGVPSQEANHEIAELQNEMADRGCAFSAFASVGNDEQTRQWLAKLPENACVLLLSDPEQSASPRPDPRDFASQLRGRNVYPPLSGPRSSVGSLQVQVWSAVSSLFREQLEEEAMFETRDPHEAALNEALQRAEERLASERNKQPSEVELQNEFESQIEQHHQQQLLYLPCITYGGSLGFVNFPRTAQSMAFDNITNDVRPNTAQVSTSTPLQAFSQWLTLPEQTLASDVWSAIGSASQAEELVSFVSQWARRHGPDSPVGQLFKRLACAMAEDPAFAEQVLNLAHESTERCQDRESLVLFRLETALMAYESSKRSDTVPSQDKVLDLARQVYLRGRIEAIAARHVAALRHANKLRMSQGMPLLTIDPVETQLAYLAELQQTLDLGGVPIEAMFLLPTLTNVDDEDIERALAELLDPNLDGFDQFLSDYGPWQDTLRGGPWKEAVESLESALVDDATLQALQTEVKALIQESGLTGQALDEAVVLEVSRRCRENSQRAWLALTQRVLQEQQRALNEKKRSSAV